MHSSSFASSCGTAMFAVVLALANPAWAGFTMSLSGYDADGARVMISTTGYNGQCTGYDCYSNLSYFTIEPCPPGQPCDGGVSQIEFDGYALHLTLGYETHYTISGYTRIQAGDYQPFDCTYTACVFTTETETQTYDVPARADVARWLVAPVEAAGSNTWVDVNIESQYVDNLPCPSGCTHHRTTVTISPCPLSARVYLQNQPEPVDLAFDCDGGTATFEVLPWLNPDPKLELLLAPGQYSVDGHWATEVYSVDDNCMFLICTFGAYPSPISFNTTTLPVQPTTWGRIKALYHN